MSLEDRSEHPLSPDLTRRVLSYLAGYRLVVATGLLFFYFLSVDNLAGLTPGESLGAATAIVFVVFAAVMVIGVSRLEMDAYRLARLTLYGDIVFLSLLLLAFGGLDSGLGVLLVFTAAVAAVLMPLREALFMTALLTLAMIGQSTLAAFTGRAATPELLKAGLFGLTAFVIAVLTHLLAFWVRDFQLTAERHRARVTRLEQINELIIRRMSTGVLALDGDCTIRMLNEAAWFLLGSPPADQRDLQVLAPELHATIERWVENPSAEPEPLTLGASQAEVVPRLVGLPEGTDIRVLVFLEDNNVIERRALDLSAASLAKLSGGIAHEIRNPLAAVSNAAQLLEESDQIPDADRRLVDIIRKQSQRMNRIVENILQLSRREKSRPDIFELKPWLTDMAHEFRESLQGVEVGLEDGGAPDGLNVLFDRSQLQQVVWKLVENASQHAGRDGEPPRVVLRVTAPGGAGYCVIDVCDNGPGIPAEKIGRIFEPFFTTRKHGSGLGLYIARQLCEANQAELTVDSSPDRGTQFHIRVPRTRDVSEDESEHHAAARLDR